LLRNPAASLLLVGLGCRSVGSARPLVGAFGVGDVGGLGLDDSWGTPALGLGRDGKIDPGEDSASFLASSRRRARRSALRPSN